jgi:hypothetical protein
MYLAQSATPRAHLVQQVPEWRVVHMWARSLTVARWQGFRPTTAAVPTTGVKVAPDVLKDRPVRISPMHAAGMTGKRCRRHDRGVHDLP